MWRSYGSEGVAIVATPELLADAVESFEESVMIGMVRYHDYDDAKAMHALGGNSMNLIMSKRHFFASENELRAVIPRTPKAKVLDPSVETIDDGIAVPVELNQLLVEVRVAPDARDWLLSVVSDVTQRYGVTAPVRRSAMGGTPRRTLG